MSLLGLVCVALFLYIYQTKTQPRSRSQSSPANHPVIEPQAFRESDPAKMRLAAAQCQVVGCVAEAPFFLHNYISALKVERTR